MSAWSSARRACHVPDGFHGLLTTVPGPDVSQAPVTAATISWELSAINDECSGRLLRLVAEALPAIEDDFAAKLVVQLSLAVIDRDDDLTAVRKVLSTSLALAHSRHWEIVRLLESLARLRAENRTLRGQPLRQPEAA